MEQIIGSRVCGEGFTPAILSDYESNFKNLKSSTVAISLQEITEIDHRKEELEAFRQMLVEFPSHRRK